MSTREIAQAEPGTGEIPENSPSPGTEGTTDPDDTATAVTEEYPIKTRTPNLNNNI